MNCKNCGAKLNESDVFCNQCGHAVDQNSKDVNSLGNDTQVHNIPHNNYNVEQHSNEQYYNSNTNNTKGIIIAIALVILFFIGGIFIGKLISENKNSKNNVNDTSKLNLPKISNNEYNKQTSNTTSKDSSYIITDNGRKVSFFIENTLKEDLSYSDEEIRCIESKDQRSNLTIWISENQKTLDEYMSSIEDKVNNMKSNKDYNSIKLSDIRTATVNNKTFSYRVLDFNMEDTEFKELYLAYSIGEESLYVVEVEGYNLLTDNELKGILSIEI